MDEPPLPMPMPQVASEGMKSSNSNSYDSSTNQRLRNPSHAQSIAENAIKIASSTSCLPSLLSPDDTDNDVDSTITNATTDHDPQKKQFRVILGLGPGRSGTKTLSELLGSQIDVIHCEHEMIVPRVYPRTPSGRIDITSPSSCCIMKEREVKGSWGADRRLEWDAPKLARGEPQRSEEEEAMWRVLRLLEQRSAFEGWVRDYYSSAPATATSTATTDDASVGRMKPKKLGSRGWREHNNHNSCNNMIQHQQSISSNKEDNVDKPNKNNNDTTTTPVVAAVSSVGLAYAHEYIALDPSVKIIVLLRPCNEVVASFMDKSKGRNHWQTHQHRQRGKSGSAVDGLDKTVVVGEKKKKDDECRGNIVQRDKTWDGAFPNMSDEECRLLMTAANTKDDTTITSIDGKRRPDKVWALRAYCKLYREVARELSQRYPNNIRLYDMQDALNEKIVQEDLLHWCGFNEPVLDTRLHLNKKK